MSEIHNQILSRHEELQEKLTKVGLTKEQAEAILEVIYDITVDEDY